LRKKGGFLGQKDLKYLGKLLGGNEIVIKIEVDEAFLVGKYYIVIYPNKDVRSDVCDKKFN
jgi:hypothetical protein